MVYNAENGTVSYRSRMHAKTKRKLPFASLTPARSCRPSPFGRLKIFSAEEFIAAITQHIPDKGFQTRLQRCSTAGRWCAIMGGTPTGREGSAPNTRRSPAPRIPRT
jgi:hypothetical protein